MPSLTIAYVDARNALRAKIDAVVPNPQRYIDESKAIGRLAVAAFLLSMAAPALAWATRSLHGHRTVFDDVNDILSHYTNSVSEFMGAVCALFVLLTFSAANDGDLSKVSRRWVILPGFSITKHMLTLAVGTMSSEVVLRMITGHSAKSIAWFSTGIMVVVIAWVFIGGSAVICAAAETFFDEPDRDKHCDQEPEHSDYQRLRLMLGIRASRFLSLAFLVLALGFYGQFVYFYDDPAAARATATAPGHSTTSRSDTRPTAGH